MANQATAVRPRSIGIICNDAPKGRQGFIAHVMFDTLGVAFSYLRRNTERQQETHDQPVPRTAVISELLTRFGQEHRALAFPADQTVALQAGQVL